MFIDVQGIEQEIKRVGQKYCIVTDNTSLLVLETLSQYLKHKIEPPKGLTKVRQKYLQIMELRKEKVEKETQDKLF